MAHSTTAVVSLVGTRPGHRLKANTTGFADGFDEVYQRKRGDKDDFELEQLEDGISTY